MKGFGGRWSLGVGGEIGLWLVECFGGMQIGQVLLGGWLFGLEEVVQKRKMGLWWRS